MTLGQERAFDYVVSLRKDYFDYHHKKEQAAYAVTVLYLGTVGALVLVVSRSMWKFSGPLPVPEQVVPCTAFPCR